uniref:Uncharacterized protein n=1 Tax=Myotis lucifugus TaxID=59463 RepID=G1QD28_MYOLU
TKAGVGRVKGNANELESQPSSHRPVHARKKQVAKDPKIPSCHGAKPVTNQAHSHSKKTRDQKLVQIPKPVTRRWSEEPRGQPGCSQEPRHPAPTRHVPPSCQTRSRQPQPLAPAAKPNRRVKGELDQVVEHFKEEEELKRRKPEKNLQPRQGSSSSKSFSLDEPSSLIPDNVAAIKKEGSPDHSSSFESKYMWTPSKQCGFCKKTHGNRKFLVIWRI